MFGLNFEQPVISSPKIYLALIGGRPGKTGTGCHMGQPQCGLIFMHRGVIGLPDVNMLFSQILQYRYILGADNMTPFEGSPFYSTRHNHGNIMAQ